MSYDTQPWRRRGPTKRLVRASFDGRGTSAFCSIVRFLFCGVWLSPFFFFLFSWRELAILALEFWRAVACACRNLVDALFQIINSEAASDPRLGTRSTETTFISVLPASPPAHMQF